VEAKALTLANVAEATAIPPLELETMSNSCHVFL